MDFESPENLLDLINDVILYANQTPFYRPLLKNIIRITNIQDFKRIPITKLSDLRDANLKDTISNPEELEWIVGPYRGRSSQSVAISEGIKETAIRYDLFQDAIKDSFKISQIKKAAVVSSPLHNLYSAEISTILNSIAIPTHIFVDDGNSKPFDMAQSLNPDILILLTDHDIPENITDSKQILITFRKAHRISTQRQLDLYMVDELGFLGHSTDLLTWKIYNDQYLYERSNEGNLVVTSLRNKTQPMLRIDTGDPVLTLSKYNMELGKL